MVKNQIIMMLGISGLCLCLVACSKTKGSNENSSILEGVSEASTEDSKELTNISKPINEGNDKDTISLNDGLIDETLEAVGKDEDGNGILGVNIKAEKENNQLLLCKDPVYDIVYYVNYGVDYFIYRLKEGKSELAVEMPAKRLFCINGKLYFMLESYETYALTDMKDGNIFCYNPISGEVSLINEAEAKTMFVYKDGIYYAVDTIIKDYGNGAVATKRDIYYYSFATAKSEEIKDKLATPYKWKDYHITYEVEEVEEGDELYEIYGTDEIITRTVGIKLETLDKTKSIKLPVEPFIQNYSIIANKLYSILELETLLILDIETKEKKEIPLAFQCTDDFTIFNGMIYIAQNLLQINPVTGVQSIITAENTDESIYEFYTDGENLYGVCGSKGGIIKRIIIEELPDDAIIVEKEDGTSYEFGRFVFHTLPMGEE